MRDMIFQVVVVTYLNFRIHTLSIGKNFFGSIGNFKFLTRYNNNLKASVCLCASPLRSLSLWKEAGQVSTTGPYEAAGVGVMFKRL